VVPSIWYENFPIAVAEAMASGRATVAAHPTALDEFVDHGRTGLLFDSGDVESLAEACRTLLADPARAEAMGREARAYYEDRLTPDASLARLVSLYERAAALHAEAKPRDAIKI
jgi:glycosyltransferase involved in cell wall biosynthesis